MSIIDYLKENITQNHKFRFATQYEIAELVKKEYPPISINDFSYTMEQPDEYIPSYKIRKLNGLHDEKREWYFDKDRKLAMFGNYTMEEWYRFLLDIAKNGLREPVLLSSDGSRIIEGNHRVQALRQLGYKFVPVRYERR